ncbi:unnamed protein product [Paramecium octaurelia]|uniref:Uncharacterized protein n=1 Tax=Paramecium octaurelia TaxID=43137 RepID=A0A8S1UT72_PAROT|nr:unnamed protein product [Paramecium octaurelia]
MRPQSPKILQTQTIATTRLISSPPRDTRQDSCSRLAKITTCQTRPKATITTLSQKPVVETRTVVLCSDKKCLGHENLIEQLTQDNNKLNQRIYELEHQIDKYDGEQQTWMSTAIEIESMRKLLEETQRNHQDEVQHLNSEIQNQEDKIKTLTSTQRNLEADYKILQQEIERQQFIIQDRDEQLYQQEYRIKDYEKQLQVGENVIEERNSQISILLDQIKQYESQFATSNNVIDQLKLELAQKDIQNQLLLQQKDSLISNYRENLDLLEYKVQQDQQLDAQRIQKLAEFESQNQDLNNKVEDLQLQLQALQEKNNYLNGQVIFNDQANSNLLNTAENQTKHLEFQLQSQADEQMNKEHFQNLQQQLYNTKQQVEEKDNLILNLNDQVVNLTTQIRDKEDKLELLHYEKAQQLAQIAQNNNQELYNYLIINEELKHKLQLKSLYELESQKLQNQVQLLQEQISDISREKEVFENSQFQLIQEINQLQECLQSTKRTEEKIVNDNQELQEQLVLQSLEVQRLQSENRDLKDKLSQKSDEIQMLNQQKTQILENNQLLQEVEDRQIEQFEIKIQELITQCDTLQSDLKQQAELNDELKKQNQFSQVQISHLIEVESQLRQLNEQTNQQQKNLQQELDNKNEEENTLKFKLETLLEDIKEKQMQLVELDRQLQLTEQANQSQQLSLEEKINYLQNEVEMWKEKFIILNRDYHKVQEDLMMVQAEFEAFNKRGLEIKNIKESTYFEVRKSSLYKENIDVKASQTSIGRLFKENI